MAEPSRSRAPSCEAESSNAGGRPPTSAPFRYLTASSEVTRYQHPSLRSLELLLPASLWSDSYVQERARYTLQPPDSSPISASSAGAISLLSSSHARCNTPRPTSTTAPALEEQRRPSFGGVGCHLSSSTPGKWSFMAIYRNLKRAREEADMRAKVAEVPQRVSVVDSAVEEKSVCRYPALSPLVDSLTSSSASLVGDCSVTESNDSDDHGKMDTVQGRGLSSSCSVSSAASRAESINAAAWYTTSAAGASEVDTQNTIARERQMRWCGPSVSACVAARPLTLAHAEALWVLKSVLDRVSAVHETQCPLCSPPRPPRWGRCSQPALPNRPALAHDSDARADSTGPLCPKKAYVMADDVQNAQELSADAGTLTAMEAHRQHLLQRARSLLNHHDDRLRYLSETKPKLFKETVKLHPLVCACAQLGGLPLLRALSATL
ncbi:hypothetical protein LSCM4_07258 [Leishmania orientalis]|uniref:Uncharacterized protein n=1 Tax=Leishmania orientalis TaxID=2249476 RepID=A0A836HF87_9TRYP|nr:hypothetical protein LSCM4_07258 [Leishmania orientalis]